MRTGYLRTLVFCCLILGLEQTAWCELATEQEMRNVAENWAAQTVYRRGVWAGETSPTITGSSEIRSNDDELLGQVYHFSPRGYVVVPVLREMSPVKMYSDESNLDMTRKDGAAQLVREILVARVKAYRYLYGSLEASQPSGGGLFADSYGIAWDRLSVASRSFRPQAGLGTEEEAGPLLSSVWYQDSPYNDSCPMGVSQRCYVGCGATAVGLIMDYWEWPERGVGEHSYWWWGDTCYGGSVPGDTLYADFSDPYDWPNIVDDYHSMSTTPEQDAAVAELCYEIGVAMEMEYGSCVSGTKGHRTSVLSTYFRYASDIYRERREDYADPYDWYSIIKNEIDADRPILYGIHSHGLVCDGYRDIHGYLEYHMNYGWDHHNAWYVMDSLYCYWLPDSLCPYEDDQMFINVRPQYAPIIELVGHTLDDTAGDNNGRANAGETFQINVTARNLGNDAINPAATLSTTDPYVTLTAPTSTFSSDIGWGEEGSTVAPFTVEVAPGCPDPYVAVLDVEVTSDGGYADTDQFLLFIGDMPGFADDFESGAEFWTHKSMTVDFADDWHLETIRRYSGSNSWKHGGIGLEAYSDLADGALVSPPFLVPPDADLRFYHWMEAEVASPYVAWDGGIVMIGAGDGLWDQIYPVGDYQYRIMSPTSGPFEEDTPCFSGSHNWQQAAFHLNAFAGEVVQIMFRFGSDPGASYEGWYVDDMTVLNTELGSTTAVLVSEDVVVGFSEVTSPGLTLMTTGTEGPEIPPGWKAVPAAQPLFYDITTTAEYTGVITVVFRYSEGDLTGPEDQVKIKHHNGAEWTDITIALDPEQDMVFGECTSLSPFILVEQCCLPPSVGDVDQSGVVDITDISILVDNQFLTLTPLTCEEEGDVDFSGVVDISDLSVIIDNQFLTLTPLPPCP